MDSSMPVKALPWTAVMLSLLCTLGCAPARRPLTPQEVAARVVLENPAALERWMEYGRVCEFSGNNRGAIRAYEYALELDAGYVPAYEHLGAACSRVGQLDKARQTYRQAFAKGLQSPLLWLGYGYCLAEAEEYSGALQAFWQAFLTADSSGDEASVVRVSALLGRAAVLRAQGQDEQAEAAIMAAAAIDPEVLELLKNGSHERKVGLPLESR